MRRANYYVAFDGRDVTARLNPVLMSLAINLTAKSRADSCSVVLDDRGSGILMPRTGAVLSTGLWWDEGGQLVQFEGKVDRPVHTTGRGQGDVLTVSAQSAERQGPLKERRHAHKDDATLADVAKEWGKKAGVSVKIDGKLGQTKRPYWLMQGESFPAWGARIAREIGATFKIFNDQAVFVPRGSGTSASGQALQTIPVERRFSPDGVQLGNLISSSLSPTDDGPEFQKFVVRYYDRAEAKWKNEQVEAAPSDGVTAKRTTRWAAPNKEQAKARAGSNQTDSEREKGGGTVIIDGEPAALPEANAIVTGIRPGIDGAYRIDSVRHQFSRSGGWTTDLTLKQPQANGGSTPGSDSRGGTSESE